MVQRLAGVLNRLGSAVAIAAVVTASMSGPAGCAGAARVPPPNGAPASLSGDARGRAVPTVFEGRYGNAVWLGRTTDGAATILTADHVLDHGRPSFFADTGALPARRLAGGASVSERGGDPPADDWAIWSVPIGPSPWLGGQPMPGNAPILATESDVRSAIERSEIVWLMGYEAREAPDGGGRERIWREIPCRVTRLGTRRGDRGAAEIRLLLLERVDSLHGFSGSGVYMAGRDGTPLLVTVAARGFGRNRVAGPLLSTVVPDGLAADPGS